jgi:hypothetical protein
MSSESERWDAELSERASPAPLLQSWAWGDVQSRAGWSVERVRTDAAMATVLLRKVGPAREAYVPRGPVAATADAIDSLIEWSRSRRMARIIVEPEATEDFNQALTPGRSAQDVQAWAPVQHPHRHQTRSRGRRDKGRG